MKTKMEYFGEPTIDWWGNSAVEEFDEDLIEED